MFFLIEKFAQLFVVLLEYRFHFCCLFVREVECFLQLCRSFFRRKPSAPRTLRKHGCGWKNNYDDCT